MSNYPVHVFPEMDTEPHIVEGTDCPCNPIVVHNSFGGREDDETDQLKQAKADAVRGFAGSVDPMIYPLLTSKAELFIKEMDD